MEAFAAANAYGEALLLSEGITPPLDESAVCPGSPCAALGVVSSAPATFEILQRTDSENDRSTERLVFQKTIEPRRTLEDRQWQPVTLDLRGDSGRTLHLIFRISTAVPQQQSLWGWAVPEIESDDR